MTFVDTNLLVYARDRAEPDKQRQAQAWMTFLWATRVGRLSTQVLNEFYVTVTRKLQPGLPRSDARADVRDLLSWNPVPTSGPLLEQAWVLEDRYGLAYWDALIVAAARAVGAERILSEDLQDGQDLDGTLVVNPFRHSPGSV